MRFHAFRLTEYEKVALIEADIFVISSIIEIFDKEFGERENFDTVSIFHWLGY